LVPYSCRERVENVPFTSTHPALAHIHGTQMPSVGALVAPEPRRDVFTLNGPSMPGAVSKRNRGDWSAILRLHFCDYVILTDEFAQVSLKCNNSSEWSHNSLEYLHALYLTDRVTNLHTISVVDMKHGEGPRDGRF
jgi:hypothetical protein